MKPAIKRRSKEETETLIEQVNKIIDSYEAKLTLRQLYYQLVAKLIIPNTINSYKNLSDILVKAREQRRVDGSRLEDRGRVTIGGDYDSKSPDRYYELYENRFRTCHEYYHRPLWSNQPVYVEVWVEKDALSRIVSGIADNLGVVTGVGKGYSSFSFVTEAAKRIERACCYSDDEVEKVPHILYFGDLDPSGEDMVRDLNRRLWEYGLDGWLDEIHYEDFIEVKEDEAEIPLFVEKLALNHAQVKQYRLPPAPVKMTDVRSTKFIEKHGTDVWELDALNPTALQDLVRQGILTYYDRDIQKANFEQERKERAEVKERVEAHFHDNTV